jgi:anti-sigma regulatory factor (Ser/Thr protein kinase)
MAQRSAQVRFTPSPQSAARARHFVARTLAAWQVLTEAAETAVLLTSELVTNALRYSQGSVDLHLHLEVIEQTQTVRVSVHDADPRMPQLLAVAAEAENGRGLWLVDALAKRWGTEQLPGDGKQVWFELAAA